MTNTSTDASTARFERIWENAQSQTRSQADVMTDAKTSASFDPMSFLEGHLPQLYAARFADLADQCFAEKELTAEQHAQLKQASATQQQIFSSMNQDKLKKIMTSIDV